MKLYTNHSRGQRVLFGHSVRISCDRVACNPTWNPETTFHHLNSKAIKNMISLIHTDHMCDLRQYTEKHNSVQLMITIKIAGAHLTKIVCGTYWQTYVVNKHFNVQNCMKYIYVGIKAVKQTRKSHDPVPL